MSRFWGGFGIGEKPGKKGTNAIASGAGFRCGFQEGYSLVTNREAVSYCIIKTV